MSCRGPACGVSKASPPTMPLQTGVAGVCSPSELLLDLIVSYAKLVNAVRSTASSDLNATLQLSSCGGLVNQGCIPATCTGGNPAIYTILQKALLEIAAVPLHDLQRRMQIACCAIYAIVKTMTVVQFSAVVYGLLGCAGPLASYLLPGPDALAAALCALLPYFWNLCPNLVTCVNGPLGSCSGQKGAAAMLKINASAAFPVELLTKCCTEPSGASFIPPGPILTQFTIILNVFNAALDCRMTGMTVTVNHAEIVAETRGNFPLVQLAQCALQYPFASQ